MTTEHARERPLMGIQRVRGTRSRARMVHHRNDDPSPPQASTAKGRPGRHLAAEGRRQRQSAAQPERLTCGNGEDGGPGRRPVPGPGCGSRITRPHPRSSAAAASAPAGSSRTARTPAPDDLATELNPHETELNPHKAIWTVPAASRASADQERCLPRTGQSPPARQLATPEPAVTPPAIRYARDAPLQPLVEPAHAYPPL